MNDSDINGRKNRNTHYYNNNYVTDIWIMFISPDLLPPQPI